MTDTILYERTGHVGRLVLNNPEKHNSLGREQIDAIRSCLTRVAADDQVRALIVTGAGAKTFCAGASLPELGNGDLGDDAFQQMAGQLADLAIPTICALNGNVFGGGVELALSCDFRIGVQDCHMRVPAAEIGLCYPLSGIQRFVATLGVNLAKRILVASESFDADTLLQIGFLDHLVLPSNLQDSANELALNIAGLAPLAVRSMKRILQQAIVVGIDADRAGELADLCLQSEDLQEGLAAKREKRAPRFSGK